MAMMAKMRSLAPAFIITVGALFVLFMIISDSNVLEAIGGRTNNIGVVNGEEITYQEYNDALEQQRELRRQQSGKEMEEEELEQFNEQVWDALVTQKLFSQQIEKYGITVTDKEIENIILGDNPPEFLKQNFIDSTGSFNKQLYMQAIMDPNNKEALIQAEEYVRQQRLNEKLQSVLLASVTVSEPEIKRKFIEQSIKINAKYAFVDLSKIQETEIQVTDEDLKKYYDNNLDKYKILPQRKVKYVMFSTNASAADSASKRTILENVAYKAKNDTLSFQDLADIYSETPYSKDTLSVSELPKEAAGDIINADANTVVGPVATPEGYVLYNVIGSVPSNETMVRASHILINDQESDEKNLEEANKIYEQLKSGASFETLAKERSADPGSAVMGGDLGWFGRGAMVPEFDKASFEGNVGEVQKPIKTNFGYHIIKVTGKTSKKFIVEKIVNEISISATTKDEVLNSANDFAYLADKNGFETTVEELNYKVQETPAFLEEAFSVPGIGANKRLVDFAFNNSVGAVSEPFKVSSAYVVVQVSEVIKEGVRSFDEVKDLIRPLVVREKKYEKAKTITEEIKNKINGDLDKAPQINPLAVVNETGEFSPAGNVPTVGRDFSFTQKAMDLEVNKVSEPVKGSRGYYLIKVINRTEFDSTAYEAQRSQIRENIMQEKKNLFFSQWMQKLKKDAEIVDNRQY